MLSPIVLVATLLAAPPPPSAPELGPGLAATSLYNGVHRPVRVAVEPPAGRPTVAIALLDQHGAVMASVTDVARGVIDLSARLPEILELRRSAYLQMLVDDEALGAPLVLQPMLSRQVPVAEVAVNPRGIRYTRIVDWYDELHPPAEPDDPAAAGADEADDDAAAEDKGEDEDEAPAIVDAAVPAGPLFSGLRVYLERDVVLHTTHGDLRLAMRPDEAPNTVWNFLTLCEGGFYDGIVFHRVVPMTPAGDPFVIQAGDPTPGGSGGPGYWLPIEPSTLAHDFGVISMARDTPPDSAGSQIFIGLSRAGTARLDGHYCAFGVTVEGAETILAIADVELADVASGRPVAPPRIERASLVPAPPRWPDRGRPDRPVRRPAPSNSPLDPPTGRVPR